MAPLAHLRQDGLSDADRADGVLVKEPLDLGDGACFDRAGEDDAGIGDEDVDLARAGNGVVDGGLVGDVEAQPLGDLEGVEVAGVTGRGDDAVPAARGLDGPWLCRCLWRRR